MSVDYIDNIDQNSIVRVKGRLRENIDFWRSIGASQWLLKVLHEGYCLPFVELPMSRTFQNHNSALFYHFIFEAIHAECLHIYLALLFVQFELGQTLSTLAPFSFILL